MGQELELRIVTDAIVRAGHLDARLIELHEQPIDRHLQDLGELGNGYFCHRLKPHSASVTRVEPRGPGRHDQLAGFFGRQTFDVREIIYRLVG
jgi:hypothetical protein